MAEVDYQLAMSSQVLETDQQFNDRGTCINRVEEAITEDMKQLSCKALLDAYTWTQMSTPHRITSVMIGKEG